MVLKLRLRLDRFDEISGGNQKEINRAIDIARSFQTRMPESSGFKISGTDTYRGVPIYLEVGSQEGIRRLNALTSRTPLFYKVIEDTEAVERPTQFQRKSVKRVDRETLARDILKIYESARAGDIGKRDFWVEADRTYQDSIKKRNN